VPRKVSIWYLGMGELQKRSSCEQPCVLCRHDRSSMGGCEEDPIGYSADVTGPNVRLEYTMHPDSRAPQLPRGTGSHMAPLRGSALVVHLPSNGGGPSMSTPRAKTYLPPGGRCYDCRQCGHLSYTSQHEDDMNRALSKAQAIRERLGGSASLGRRFPAKPKGMWWSTYRRLRASSEDMWVACLHAGPVACG
jgi:hypothetical protein